MALKYEYGCDKCGHTQPTSDQMWRVKVAYNPVSSSGYYTADHWSSKEQMWCRKCMENAGIVTLSPTTIRSEPPPVVKPTLEELLREIAREEIAQMQTAGVG